MGENFAFFLPIMMASFGAVFLGVAHWQVPAARLWSAAFFSIAAAFAMPMGFMALPGAFWGTMADLLFLIGFLLFSQALLDRWRRGWLLRSRVAILAFSLLVSGYAQVSGNLVLELLASDLGCFLLIALPLVPARNHMGLWRDRALFVSTALVALDCLVRGSTVPFTLAGPGSFLDSDYAYLMQALACVFGLFLALSALGASMLDLLERYQEEALIDPLSGLLNRRGLDLRVKQLGARATGCVMICDIDRFKTVNDRFGHDGGDHVIALLARMLRETLPAGAMAARFGGEEFVVLDPEWNPGSAFAYADHVREHFAGAGPAQLGMACNLTASFGIAPLGGQTVRDAIAHADEALYEAKARGRNRVCLYRPLSLRALPQMVRPLMAASR